MFRWRFHLAESVVQIWHFSFGEAVENLGERRTRDLIHLSRDQDFETSLGKAFA